MKKLYVLLMILSLGFGQTFAAAPRTAGCFNPELAESRKRADDVPYVGNIYLYTQADVDQFATNYPGVTSITGELGILDSVDITNLAGLNAITSVGYLNIYGNSVLSDLSGLNNLTTVVNDCFIGNAGVTAMSGLNGVTSVGGNLIIQTGSGLQSLTGFNALQSVNNLYIYYNDSLTTIPQFLNLTSASYVAIYQNPQLATCDSPGICSVLANATADVFGNAPGCNNIQQLQMACGLPVTCSDVYLYGQVDVDNFVTNFGCSIITGTLYITGNDVTNLNGLSSVTKVGYLNIYDVPSLTNFSGLNNIHTITQDLNIGGATAATVNALSGVTTIGGSVNISSCYNLVNFLGLSNVTSIGQNLYITYNSLLTALPGMISLTSVGGGLSIQGDDALIGLSGLNNLASVGQGISISYNGALTNISALSNLTSMNGTLEFYNNNSLTSLSGINNPSGITYLNIAYSPLLSVCSVPAVCNYLENGGGASIYGNAPGCGNYNQVRVGCGQPQNCGYVSLYSQEDVDNYSYNYGCTAVETIYISGSGIENLDGLSMITSAESIQFSYVSGLTDVSGLSNITSLSGNLQISGQTQTSFPSLPSLTSIGGNFYVEYTTMEHLPSLPNLTSLGGQFYIYSNDNLLDVSGMPLLNTIGGDLSLGDNDLLADLSAFSSVTSVDGSLYINNNSVLTALTGLENLNPANLNSLNIYSNPLLALCTLPNICTFLNNGGGNSISDNAIGCEDYAALAAVCNAGCPTTDVVLSTQAEVDDFGVNFPTCTIVGGSLTIAGTDITDLSPLSNIVSINGTLNISGNDALTSLAGLSALTTIRGDLQVYNNNALTNLTGLAALASVDYSVNIENNIALTSLNGLSALTDVGGSLNINYNPMLTSLEALGNITSLPGGNLNISGNDALVGLAGLNLTSVYGSMSITNNPALASLSALSGLTSVQSLYLSNNDALPSAAGLSGLTSLNYASIEGNDAMTSLGFNASSPSLYNLTIANNPSLTDISSLSPIVTINDLYLTDNTSLTSLTGLNNLTTLSNLNISGNTALTSLAALGNLTQVYNLQLGYNDSLTNLNGLQQLADAPSTTFHIIGNASLASLSGLENLTSVYNLTIDSNPSLASLQALSSLAVVRYLYLNDNDALTTLAGLEAVTPSQLYYLSLQSSNNLSTCDLPNICTYLTNGGSANISGNASGCNNTFDLQLACGPTGTCPTGALTFTSQSQIDQFILAYPSCTSLPSYVTISGADITNLNGLANITYIANPLVIDNNPLLTNLTGLNNLNFVGALTISNNPALTSLAALSNLNTNCYSVSIDNNDALTSLNGIQNLPIFGNITVANNGALTSLITFNNVTTPGYVTIHNNDALVSFGSLGNFSSVYSMTVSENSLLNSLSGLNNLTQVRYISVSGNNILTSLSGLENLNPNYLYGLNLYSSAALSTCALPNICTFLSNGGSNYITGNATGCNSSTEVQVACGNGEPPTFTAVSPSSVAVCDGQNLSVTLSGLVPDSISVLTYSFNGVDTFTTNVYANASGNAPFNATVSLANNGQTLTLISLERVDVMTGTLTLTTNNTVALSVSPTVTYYRDFDGDTFGNLYDTVAACTGLPVGYVTNSTDCYDYDPTIYNYAENVYSDNDQDGYDAGLTSVCYGATLPPQYSLVTNGPDCNDYEPLYHQQFAFYYDADQDGYGTGNLVQACAESATIAPPYYSLNNTDCSPFNPNIFNAATLYIDIDGDNYNNGNSFVCYGANVPAGYSATTNGTDCDDNDPLKQTTYPFYVDTDGDGYGSGTTVLACAQSAVITPVGYATNNTDCAPTNANAFQQGLLFVDADGDQYDAGSQTVCYGTTAPAGYSLTTNGSDCNDNDAAAHTGYAFYADADSDGYGSGSLVENVCALNATTPPPGYSLNNLDCAPSDPGIYLGYPFYVDNDNDGYGAGDVVTLCTPGPSAPPGYSVNNSDCNDNQVLYADNDGDGFGSTQVAACGATNSNDCNDNQLQYLDADGDGFGSDILVACGVTNSDDCNDSQLQYLDADGDGFGANVFAACGVTNNADCNDNQLQYLDADGDSFGSMILVGCGVTNNADCNDSQIQYLDADADGFGANVFVACGVTNNADCNDNQLQYLDADGDSFGSMTLVGCGVANNADCNDNQIQYLDADADGFGANIFVACGVTNNADCNDNQLQYLDADGDSFGSMTLVGCGVTNNADCNDSQIQYLDADGDGFGANIFVACGVTNNADCNDNQLQYLDADGDSFGSMTLVGCGVTNNSDCNDNQIQYLDADADGFGANVFVACGVTNNADCNDNQLQYLDADGDSFGSMTLVGCGVANNSDCNDSSAIINPNAAEICNGIDDDCDGLIDGNDPSVTSATQTLYYADADGDNFGNIAVSVLACVQPVGYVLDNTDCDDANNMLYPGQIWILDNDNDGYGAGATTVSCTRPLNGFFANELTSATGDCNDNNPMINPVAQRLEFSGATNFTSSVIAPTNGTLYTNFTFEVTYYDANNQLPPATFPRVYLDYEGNGSFNGANDRAVIMTPYDVNDTNTADGKRYIGTINGLAYGTNWQTRVQVQNGACITEIGPFNYPDVQVQSDLQIFANDITFSSNHPAAASPLTVNAVVHNISDFPAENFYVKLVNQFDPGIVYGDVLVSNVPPHGATTVTWNITTPAVPAWCPMQVIVDNTNVISESDELDNTAIRPFINGNYNLLGGIEVVNVGASPTVSYITSSSDAVTVFGRGLYYGTPTPLPDPSVAGATVTFTIVETGATYSTYTNSSGYFSQSFPAPITPGVYHITGEMTDFTFLGNFTSQFERILYVQPCTTDVWASIQTSNNTAMVADNVPPNTILAGESISGTFTVYNGCATVGASILDVTQNGGSAIADVNIPALASGASYSTNFSNIVFNAPGQYTICATADGGNAIAEVNENNAACTTINVLPNQPDIYPYYGPGNTAAVCASNTLNFTLYNGGGAVTGSFNVDVIVRKDNVVLTTLHHTVPNINALSFYGFSFPYTYASAGNYSFELQCDVPTPNGIVSEVNETNNTVTYGVTAYDCVFKPDLTLAGCENFDVSPSNPQFPGSVTYTATIQNGGNATAVGPIAVRFSLSGGQTYNTTYNGNIAAGQTVTVSVNAPSVAPATQTLTAMVDYNNAIEEWSEANNSISNSLCWDFQPVDRVYPCGSNFWDYTQIANQPVYLSVAVNQYGMYDASSVDVRFQVSGPGLSGTVDLGNAVVTDLEQTCYCPASAVLPYSFVFPEEGVYTFTMTVDPDNTYVECNESNNVIVRQVNVTHLPDMRVLSQYINPSLLNPEPGEPISLAVTYENIGTTNLADTMQLSVLVDDVPLASVPVTGLGTGENATVAIPVPWSSTVVGPHIIRTIIDSNNQVAESNETNNEATRAIVVGEAANLYFVSLAASNPSPSMGAPITINATIGNNGDLDVEADVQFFYMTDGLLQEPIGSMHISVANNSNLNIQFPWTVLDPSTTIVVKIINASVLEFTYDDNESTTVLGGMGLTFQSTTACTGLDNGTLTVQPSGGVAPYTYEWENGYNGPMLTAAAGTYEVTVTDNTGLSVTATGTITNGAGSAVFYADADGDGFGNPVATITACEQPVGYVANDDDCDDTKNTVHPGATEIGYNLIDDDCDGQTDEGFVPKVTIVQGALCGITLASIDTPLVANIVAGAQGYRWKITTLTGPNTGQIQILDTALRTMKLTQLVNYAFATQYKVEVGVFYAGYPQPFGVSNCTVTTPSPSTSLTNCSQQLSAMADAINANMVSFSAGYRFKVTDPVNPSNTQNIDSNTRQFRMNQITAFAVQYGKVYNVEVAVKNQDGTYLPFGSICNVTTPIFPTTSLQDSQCNSYNVPSMTTPLYAISHPGAIAYVFQLTGPGFPTGVEVTKSTRSFTLADFTGLVPGATYTVKVRLVFNMADPIGPFGKACTIVTPGALRASLDDRFDAVAYPNPFADNFGIDVTTSSDQAINVKVYDMAGRLLEDQSVKAARVESLQIGARYPAGVYNVVVTQGEQTKTLRVIKR